MADKKIILNKFESLRHCLHRIEDNFPPSADVLKEDYDMQDIVSVNLERTVQLIVDTGLHIVSRDFETRPIGAGPSR
jgi:uncharacterized protein YutE (UPF0331/DUF86 family)